MRYVTVFFLLFVAGCATARPVPLKDAPKPIPFTWIELAPSEYMVFPPDLKGKVYFVFSGRAAMLVSTNWGKHGGGCKVEGDNPAVLSGQFSRVEDKP